MSSARGGWPWISRCAIPGAIRWAVIVVVVSSRLAYANSTVNGDEAGAELLALPGAEAVQLAGPTEHKEQLRFLVGDLPARDLFVNSKAFTGIPARCLAYTLMATGADDT